MAAALLLSQFNFYGSANVGGATNLVVDASTEGLGFVFQANSADAITHLGFRYGARTGTPPTYVMTLEGIDASGLPDGADIGGGSPTAVTFTPPADASIDGIWQWKTLTNAYTPSRGQFLAGTIRYSSGTIDGSNNSSFTRSLANLQITTRGLPYHLGLAGTWTKQATPAVFGYRTASGRYGVIGISGYATVTANTAGHMSGMFFTLSSDWGDTFKVAGIRMIGKLGAAGGSCKVGIWNTAGTLLQSVTLDGDATGANGASSDTQSDIYFSDATLATLSYGTKYYVGIEVVSGTCSVAGVNLTEAEDRSAWPNGVNRGLVTYNGSYTETTTTLPLIDLILADITEPAGGGGGMIVHPGMNGGLRG